jgi:hypothetical protein
LKRPIKNFRLINAATLSAHEYTVLTTTWQAAGGL